MDELIESIRRAVSADASAEEKQSGAQACRAILAALGAEPGKPITLPSAPVATPIAGVSLEQVLELAIARLRPIAEARTAKPAPEAATAPIVPSPPPKPPGMRIPIVSATDPRTKRPR